MSFCIPLEESKSEATILRDVATEGRIAKAVADSGGNFDLLSPMIKAQLADNPDLDLPAHVTALRQDDKFAAAFKASDQSGTGSDPSKAADTTGTRQRLATADLRRGTMSDKQKNEYQKAHGLDALLDLPL